MQNIRFLRYVDAVARTGSIRKAAEQLNVVSSAVNRRILDIEEQIGAPLFERQPRGVRLTSAGELFVAYARKQIAEQERVLSEIEDLRSVRRGEVRIAAIEGMAAALLPLSIGAFQKHHPKVRVKTLICGREEVYRALKEFRADIGLVFNPAPDPEIRTLMEVEQRLYAFVVPDHPLTRLPRVRLSDCLGFPIAMPDASLGGRALLDQLLARRSIRVEAALETNSFELMRHFAIQSEGVFFQIQMGIPPSHLTERVKALPLVDRDLLPGRLVLGTEHTRALPVATAKFVEYLKQTMNTLLS